MLNTLFIHARTIHVQYKAWETHNLSKHTTIVQNSCTSFLFNYCNEFSYTFERQCRSSTSSFYLPHFILLFFYNNCSKKLQYTCFFVRWCITSPPVTFVFSSVVVETIFIEKNVEKVILIMYDVESQPRSNNVVE